MPQSEVKQRKNWRTNLADEPWRDRLITLLCSMGVIIPVGRGYNEGLWPWQWTGDRILIIILFVVIGAISVGLTSED